MRNTFHSADYTYRKDNMPKRSTPRLCTVPDCGRKHHARGRCIKHYIQDRNRDRKPPKEPALPAICAVEYCPDPAKFSGMCARHHTNMRRHGKPEAPRSHPGRSKGTPDPVEFIRNRMVVTDLGCWEMLSWQSEWGYTQIDWLGERWQAHRWSYVHLGGRKLRRFPVDQLDHICVNPACIRPCHLQIVTAQENSDLKELRQQMLEEAGPGAVLKGPNIPKTLTEWGATVRLCPATIGLHPGARLIFRWEQSKGEV